MAEVKEISSAEVKVGDDTVAIRTFSLSTNGVVVHVSNVGASIGNIIVPNYAKDDGAVDDVVLGYKSAVDMYESRNPVYLATIVGRVANRIAKGRFTLDGKEYSVSTNNGPNHLHGGDDGFSHRIWDAQIVDGAVQFSLVSQDGDQRYPGGVEVKATYSLVSEEGKGATLKLHMVGKLLGDTPTPINLAQHSYFNLAGHNHEAGVLDHKLTMPCEAYTPTDPTAIPTREVRPLDEDSAMDWRTGRIIRDALVEYGTAKSDLTEKQVKSHFGLTRCNPDLAKSGSNCANPDEPYGFDHNYVVFKKVPQGLNLVGSVEYAGTGRRLRVMTDAPGVQLYSANWLDGANRDMSKDETAYGQWQGLCLETQTFPDGILESSEDHPEFAKGKCFILRPGGSNYSHQVEYHFEAI